MRQLFRDFILRLVVIAAILLTLGRVYGDALVSPILPAFAWVIERADSHFRVDSMTVIEVRSNTVIQLKATPVRILTFGENVVMPNENLQFSPTTLVGSVWQPIIVFLAVLLAWPAPVARVMAIRLLLALPALAVLLATNVPLGFIGVMLDFRAFLPMVAPNPWVYWNDFLQTGGPLVMAIAASLIVVSGADQACRRSIPNASTSA
jgi:hypothetical protein